jgi:ketosteroid isomerase-like protein
VSQENVELVLRSIQPGPDVDFVSLFRDDSIWAATVATTDAWLSPDCKFVIRGLPGGERTYVGIDGLRAGWLDWLAPWVMYRAEVVKAVDLGERVLLLYHSFGRLAGSAVDVEGELASVWTVRDGKVPYAEFYATTHAEALQAVGLKE